MHASLLLLVFVRLLVPGYLIGWLVSGWLVDSSLCSFVHWFIPSFLPLFVHSFIQAVIRLFIHSLTHSLTVLFTHSCHLALQQGLSNCRISFQKRSTISEFCLAKDSAWSSHTLASLRPQWPRQQQRTLPAACPSTLACRVSLHMPRELT